MDLKNDYALVTGASMGIGRAISRELARRGINVLLVALDTPELQKALSYIKVNFSVKVDALGIDLTERGCGKVVHDWCREQGYVVRYLINNAGFGEGGYFENVPMDVYHTMMDLNVKAYVSLIHAFLPDMKKKRNCHIMNTSSMEAIFPLPYKAVYTGTKNFIYSYSMALSQEVKRYGVKISILCPGPVVTNESGLRRLRAQGKKAQLMVLMPEDVAEIAVPRMLKGKLEIFPGKVNWILANLFAWIPIRLKIRALEKIFRVYK